MTKDPAAGVFLFGVYMRDSWLALRRTARELPIIPRQGKLSALSLLNFDVATCVAIFWL
jgi:hypothetical protein